MTTTTRDILVIGGGISGLTAAWRLARAGADVALLEAAPEAGGCLRTERRDGFLLEKGPFNVLVRDEAFHDLLAEGGDELGLVRADESARARYVLRRGGLHLVPTGPGGLLRTPLLSAGGKLRLVRGALLSAPARGDDETIFAAAERRLGRETAETFVSALVAGVYGGDARHLSLRACFPSVARFDREARSPLLAGIGAMRRRRRERAVSGAPRRERLGLVSFTGGLRALTDSLAARLGPGLVTSCPAQSITRDDETYTVHGAGGAAFRARTLLLATPAAAAADLLAPLAPRAAERIRAIESASLVVLNLAFRRERVAHPLNGYGFLVPPGEGGDAVMGVLWASSAFPHHAPPSHHLLRVFMGGPRDPGAVDRDETDLLRTARAAVDGLLGIEGEPDLVDVCRWPGAIPQYRPGHVELVEEIARETAHLPRLHLLGNYLTGVSINDCVRDGARAAETIRAAGGAGTPSSPLEAIP